MKLKSFFILLILLIFSILISLLDETNYHAVYIDDNCNIGIDINKNLKISEKEIFSLENISPFCSEKSIADNESKIGKLSQKEKIFLKYQTKQLYENLFLTANIRFDKGKILTDLKNPEIIILQEGLALANNNELSEYENLEKLQKLRDEANKKDYVLLNTKSFVYHKLDCPKGIESKNKQYIISQDITEKHKPCSYCFKEIKKIKLQKQNSKIKNILHENYYKNGNIEYFANLGAGTTKTSFDCTTKLCSALKNEIDNAKQNIDITIYEINKNHEITKALQNAAKRGVKINVVTDNGNYKTRPETIEVIKTFAQKIFDDAKTKDSAKLMHNKFVIIDDNIVYTGSTNFTSTGLSGFNANNSILIRSADVAKRYKQEFLNFSNHKYHTEKNKNNYNDLLIDNTKINTYFSPQDNIINSKIIPEIKKSQKYIYIPTFIITHKQLSQELINAKKRGVDVKIILDATNARNKYSTHTMLRQNQIKVKTENFAGKMHMKTVIIDDKTAFIGSMNFTKSGNLYNDENCIKIENPDIVKNIKISFLDIWEKIPDKYLYQDPSAESPESEGSCFDGIDNDFDGKIDSYDAGCKP